MKKNHNSKKEQNYRKVFSELLSQIHPVDFREQAGLDEDAKVALKRYSVISIEEIIKTAESNDWGLCTKNECIHVSNGQYWQVVDNKDFKSFLGNAAIKMGVPILDAKHHLFRDELFNQFVSVSNFPTPQSSNAVLVNLLNGTFEITNEEQRLREFRREDFITYQLPFEYNPEAKCPMFMKYLVRVLPDTENRKVLAEFLGYIFVNNMKLEKALILYGSGANGKSVLFEIVNAILGSENICSYSLEELTKTESYHRAELSNKLLNYVSEISKKMNTTKFKLLVSNEPVEARHIYGRPFTLQDYSCKFMFNCNELPSDVEHTNAFFRRFIIIPFEQTIPEDEQDPNLAKKIIASELSGVFNWILKGLNRLLAQRKFTESAKVREQVQKYRIESDSVAMFIDEEGYVPSITEKISLQDLYSYYVQFCQWNGYRPCTSRRMAERLRNWGVELQKLRKGLTVYVMKNTLD